jgi:hypothetical protein
MITTVASILIIAGSFIAGQGTDATPCEHLRLMTRLARIAASGDVDVISKQADLTCSANVPAARWPNNQRIVSVAGRWQYPGGTTAKTPPGHWYYPDGKTTARTITNDWFYPDGRTQARNRRGGWVRPDGRSTTVNDLLKWSCDRVDAALCKGLTADYGRTTGDEQAVALIELAWAAHSKSPR